MRKRLVTHANVIHCTKQRVVVARPQNILGTVLGIVFFNVVVYHFVAQCRLHIVLYVHVNIETSATRKRLNHATQFGHINMRQCFIGSLHRVGLLARKAHCSHRVARVVGKSLVGTCARIVELFIIYRRQIHLEIVRCHIVKCLWRYRIESRSPFGSLFGEETSICMVPQTAFVAACIHKVLWRHVVLWFLIPCAMRKHILRDWRLQFGLCRCCLSAA